MKNDKLSELAADEIKELFLGGFAAPPWNGDRSDERQLDEYHKDLMSMRTLQFSRSLVNLQEKWH